MSFRVFPFIPILMKEATGIVTRQHSKYGLQTLPSKEFFRVGVGLNQLALGQLLDY